tara:strand:- start:12197 stop:12496 length:300 start_codon:yes stop_codon:yes gene_type:complete
MLKQLHCVENPDLTVEKYGTLRNRSGVKLRLSNVEFVSDDILAHWQHVLSKHGFSSKIKYDSSTRVVTIVGKEKQSLAWVLAAVAFAWFLFKVVWQYVL